MFLSILVSLTLTGQPTMSTVATRSCEFATVTGPISSCKNANDLVDRLLTDWGLDDFLKPYHPFLRGGGYNKPALTLRLVMEFVILPFFGNANSGSSGRKTCYVAKPQDSRHEFCKQSAEANNDTSSSTYGG